MTRDEGDRSVLNTLQGSRTEDSRGEAVSHKEWVGAIIKAGG